MSLILHYCPSIRRGGSKLFDLSGYANHATLQGMNAATDWVVDDSQYALDFDGVDDVVYSVFDHVHITTKNNHSFSITAWIKFLAQSWVLIAFYGSHADDAIRIRISSDKLQIRNSGGGDAILLGDTGVTPSTNQWYHFAYTWDGSSGKTYLDGLLKDDSSQAPISIDVTALFLGHYTNSSLPSTFTGRLDDIRIYDTAISENYVSYLASARGHPAFDTTILPSIDLFHGPRRYYALVSATVNATPLYYANNDYYFNGTWYAAKLLAWPEPNDASGDDFVILTADNFDIVLEDTDSALVSYDDDWPNTTWTVTLLTHYDDYTTGIFSRQMTCTSWIRQAGRITLQLEDVSSTILEKLYPEHTYNADGSPATYPDLLDSDVGRPVPIVVGYGIKVPCVLLNNHDGDGPWEYGVCEILTAWYYAVDNVYRGSSDGGPLVDESEYTQTTYTGDGITLVAISFPAEQTDFSGQPYTIWADVRADTVNPPTTQFNAAIEAARLLTWAGLTPDTTSFTAAALIASTEYMLVDWCYARDGNQTTLKALLDKLLLVLRGQIYRADDGEWEIWQDTAGSSVARYDEDVGDLIEVSSYRQPVVPATIKLLYQPDLADPGKLKHTITRNISGGLGESIDEAEMIRDFTAADYLLSYLRGRRQYAKTAEATLYGTQHQLGDVITIASSHFWSGDKDWIIRGISRIAGGNQLELIEYQAAVYAYVPGAEPADGNTDAYGTDYSQTMPLAPTGFALTGSPSSGVEIGNGGIYTAYVNLICTPPAVNWKKIYFATSDGSSFVEGVRSGSDYIGTLRGLIPGKAYTLQAWAENSLGVTGASGIQGVNFNFLGQAVTFTIANNRINLVGHGYNNNDTLRFSHITLTTGISINTTYYVVGAAADYFQVSLTLGGAAIDLATSDGTGIIGYVAATDATAPAVPSAPTATQGTGKSVNVSWSAVADADIAGYILKRATSSGGTYSEVWRGNALTKNDVKPTLSYGTTYYYKLAAYDYSGNTSADSSASSGVTLSYIDGSSEVRTINSSYITSGSLSSGTIDGVTITGSTIRTASGTTRIEMNVSSNELRVYNSGDIVGTFGLKTSGGSDYSILEAGAEGYTGFAGRFENESLSSSTVYIKNFQSGSYPNGLEIARGNLVMTAGHLYLNGTGDLEIAAGDINLNDNNCIISFNGADIYRYNSTTIGVPQLWSDGDINATGKIAVGTLGTSGTTALYRNASHEISSGVSSDIRLKKDVVPIASALTMLRSLAPIQFSWVNESWGTDRYYGVSAQSFLDSPLENLVSLNRDGFYEVNIIGLVPILVAAIQELQGHE